MKFIPFYLLFLAISLFSQTKSLNSAITLPANFSSKLPCPILIKINQCFPLMKPHFSFKSKIKNTNPISKQNKTPISFWLLSSAATIATAADIGVSQHCIQLKSCREANPLMPSSTFGMNSVMFSMTTAYIFLSHWLWTHHKRFWSLPLLSLIGFHSGAAIWGLFQQ